MKTIKIKLITLIGIIILISISLTSVSALSYNITDEINVMNDQSLLEETDSNLEEKIINIEDNGKIVLNPGTYKINDVEITKNISIQGNGNPRNIIIDGSNKSNIFIIRNETVHVSFKNLTFINANTNGFGGAISMETGNVYVDNCHFINNTAGVNAGGISNYGTTDSRGHLLVNNSFFMNNHAGHDGGAITTCYADSYIYNSVFIDNSAHRDGGAIRVSVSGYGNVEDCIFMFNHADEWGGAYYSWSGESNIKRCIFMNNTAGTNGGAVMISGNINLEQSIIVNNNGGETGGSFYIQQPMYDAKTIMNIHDNIITNNSSPYGREIFIKWDDIGNLYTKFNNNDWGDEDPNDSSVIDPNHVTSRSKVTSTIKSDLFNRLNLNLLDKYSDFLKSYFPGDSLDNLKKQFDNDENSSHNTYKEQSQSFDEKKIIETGQKITCTNTTIELNAKSNNASNNANVNSNSQLTIGNSTSYGNADKAYELNETVGSIVKQASLDLKYFVIVVVLVLILLLIGYKREKKTSK